MSNNFDFPLPILEFGSVLSYSPHGKTIPEQRSKTSMNYLKNDYLLETSISMSEYISNLIILHMNTIPFADFFTDNLILVPVPRSSLRNQGDIWVPRRLADAMLKKGLGKEVKEYLIRIKALPKSAKSISNERPTADQHFESLQVEKTITEPKEILLIDDIITRGATMYGAANRLAIAFPHAHIRAFAAMRTMCPPLSEFKQELDPCLGKITMNNKTRRNVRRP